MKKVLIGPSSFAQLDKTPMEILKREGFTVIDNPFKRRLTEDELMELLTEDVTGLIAGLEPLNKKVLYKSTLKVISRVGAGLSNIDITAAKELNIDICYTPYGPTKSVAELTIANMLSLLKFVPQMDNLLHRGKWEKRIGFLLESKTVVIVGYGRIGKQVTEFLNPFGVKIIIVDPFVNEDETEHKVKKLEESLADADIFSLHLSGEACVLGVKEFAEMKKGVFILNAARGGLIDENALKEALDSGKVSGAWLDAFEKEPYDGPLTKYENVILTPHVGSYTLECRKQMETEAVQNLINSFNKNH